VVVTVGGLASNGVTFTVTVPPTLTSLSPVSGPIATAVTDRRDRLRCHAEHEHGDVQWSGGDADELVRDEHRGGPSPRERRRATWSSPSAVCVSNGVTFTVTVPPTLTSLSPVSGPIATAVTIAGTGFGATQSTSTVTFNGAAATPTSWSATSIAVPVPTGATTGNVVVTVSGLASTACRSPSPCRRRSRVFRR